MANIILHQIGKTAVGMKAQNGYINATAMAKGHKERTGQRKDVADWIRLSRTKEKLKRLSVVTEVPVTELCQVFKGAPETGGGTWIHPDLNFLFVEWLEKKSNKKPSKLYIFADKSRGVCKIGISSNPEQRLVRIQCGYPWPLEILQVITVNDASKAEALIHYHFAEFRLNGEWFKIEALNSMAWAIGSICGNL
jgi:KilA-N domain/Meiotically up-regulated gene 113